MLSSSDAGRSQPAPLRKNGADDGRSSARSQLPARVMLVEDDDDIREGLEALLSGSGYQVQAFARGEAALAALAVDRPDIILLDLMMPGLNGWQFRVEQKKTPRLAEIPVVVLTADVSAYAAAIDASAFLAKPVDIDELERVIERILVNEERKRLARRAMELERVRSLGMLVASVAHEVNNPLTYLLGCLDLAEQDVAELSGGQTVAPELVHRLGGNIESARDGARRVASTVQLISTFSRAEGNDPDDIAHVTRAIRAAARLARHQVEARASLTLELIELPPVHGNEARLAQVMLNLLVNAAQAIPTDSARAHEVRVRTLRSEREVTVEVSDTGGGIAPDVLEQIFDPFFTTKAPGEGTGLGLSISRDIVSEMGGTLSAESRVGHGSTFRLTLPISSSHPAHTPSQFPSAPSGGPDSGGHARRRVLVVDDEPLIGKFVKAALPSHDVELITDPSDALARVFEIDHDLILCDLRMPTMSGIALYHALIAVRPKLHPVFVLMTGAGSDAVLDRFVEDHDVPLLPKPFTLKALRALVASREAREPAP